jgi:hypothetical protein
LKYFHAPHCFRTATRTSTYKFILHSQLPSNKSNATTTTWEQRNANDMPPQKISEKKWLQSNDDNGAKTQAQGNNGNGAKNPQHSAKQWVQSNDDNHAKTQAQRKDARTLNVVQTMQLVQKMRQKNDSNKTTAMTPTTLNNTTMTTTPATLLGWEHNYDGVTQKPTVTTPTLTEPKSL